MTDEFKVHTLQVLLSLRGQVSLDLKLSLFLSLPLSGFVTWNTHSLHGSREIWEGTLIRLSANSAHKNRNCNHLGHNLKRTFTWTASTYSEAPSSQRQESQVLPERADLRLHTKCHFEGFWDYIWKWAVTCTLGIVPSHWIDCIKTGI